MKKIETGVFIGKFLPLHLGHVKTIFKYSKKCKKFFLILADSNERSASICTEANLPIILPEQRLVWLKKIFGDKKNIQIEKMPKGMLETFPDGLEEWKENLFNITKAKEITWFVDKNYLDISHKVFPEINFVGFDRTKINISASEIRNSISENKKYLPKEVFEYFKLILKL